MGLRRVDEGSASACTSTDCFNLTRPRCSRGKTVFHEECIAGSQRVEGGRPFDTLENQIRKNGDAGKQLVVKMDVEGRSGRASSECPMTSCSESTSWPSSSTAIDEARFIFVMSKLKEFFYIANLHWNNFGCDGASAPFHSWAYELLLVNKRSACPILQSRWCAVVLDRPNNPELPDCQAGTVEVAPARH